MINSDEFSPRVRTKCATMPWEGVLWAAPTFRLITSTTTTAFLVVTTTCPRRSLIMDHYLVVDTATNLILEEELWESEATMTWIKTTKMTSPQVQIVKYQILFSRKSTWESSISSMSFSKAERPKRTRSSSSTKKRIRYAALSSQV